MPPKTIVAKSTTLNRIWRLLAVAATFICFICISSLWLTYLYFDRTTGELMRYAERRLIGHPRLESGILPIFGFLRPYIERPVPSQLPSLGKGQHSVSLPPQQYTLEGSPTPSVNTSSIEYPQQAYRSLSSEADIMQAIANVRPGQVLEITPGSYSITTKIHAKTAGLKEQPITVRSLKPGSVTLLFATTEGFHVTAPYWIFENLIIRGQCKHDSDCEHAFHVVGKARGTVIRNNHIENFNAHIKVNGANREWPDDGLIQNNTLTNTHLRKTHLPVTPIDIVGANSWQIVDNVISNFIKGDGDKISYGVFMKGAGSKGRIERNLIICSDTNISQAGSRVGLSFGGGGTTPALCRDQRCITEYSQGIAINNIIAHCNDFGIYINKSNQTIIAHNTLINTYGIDIRFPTSSVFVRGNHVDGRIRERDGGSMESSGNEEHSFAGSFDNADRLQFNRQKFPEMILTHQSVTHDFCMRLRQTRSLPGALSTHDNCETWTQ
jgi:parallel beta-helix repeat protein